MGLLELTTSLLVQHVLERGAGIIITTGFAALVFLAVVLNVLNQLLLKNPNEPPVVFHWFPVVGNTVTYGIDPYKFFFDCRAKASFVPYTGL